MAVVALSVTGCTAKGGAPAPSSSSSPSAAASRSPSPSPSPSRTTAQAAGKGCSELLEQVIAGSGMQWRFDDGTEQAQPETLRKPGGRKCVFVVSSTDTLPPAMMSVGLNRPFPDVDTPNDVLQRATRVADGCTEALPSAPPALALAVQCLKRRGDNYFDVRTTLCGPNGYVSVLVATQPKTKPTSTLEAKVREVSRLAATTALEMV